MLMSEEMLWLVRGGSYDTFPRLVLHTDRLGFKYLTFVNSYDELMKYVRANNKLDRSVGIYTQWQIDNEMYDTIMFDIDYHTGKGNLFDVLESAYEKLMSLRAVLNDNELDFSRVYVTGRGFNAYIDFDLSNIPEFKRKYVKFIEHYAIQNYVDIRRVRLPWVSRFVGSRNSKALSNIIVKRIDFTKPTFREAFYSVAPWKKYDNIVSILNSL